MVQVILRLGQDYIDDLVKRMKRLGVSQNALAREMGASPSQVSRWFTPNPERKVSPEWATMKRIEEAMARLDARKRRQG
jgi:predicted transcriptional regulator